VSHTADTLSFIEGTIRDMEHDVRVAEADLDAKRRRRDFHGVRDACVDIETMEAKIVALRAIRDLIEATP
jgi:hypothetical protein